MSEIQFLSFVIIRVYELSYNLSFFYLFINKYFHQKFSTKCFSCPFFFQHNFFTIIFTESSPTGPIQSLSCNFCLCLCVCVCTTFCVFLLFLITPIYKGQKSNRPIAKRFLREKLRKDIGLRFINFCSETVVNTARKEKKNFPCH